MVLKIGFWNLALSLLLVSGLSAAEDAGGGADQLLQQEVAQLLIKEGLRKAEAKDLAASAARALELGQYDQARRLYQRAVELDPDDEDLRARLKEVERYLPSDMDSPASQMLHQQESQLIRQQAILAEIENFIGEAQRKYEEGISLARAATAADMDQALILFRQSQNAVQRTLLKIGGLSAAVDASAQRKAAAELGEKLLKTIETTAARRDELARQEALKQLDVRKGEIQKQEEDLRQAYLTRARDHLKKRQFSEALLLAQQVEKTHPMDMEVLSLIREIQSERQRFKQEETNIRYDWEKKKGATERAQDLVGTTKWITYPPDWVTMYREERIGRGEGAIGRELPEWEVDILKKLEVPISFDFTQVPLREVLLTLSQVIGVNIIPPSAFAVETRPAAPTIPREEREFMDFEDMFRDVGAGPAAGMGAPLAPAGPMVDLSERPVTLRVDNMRAGLSLKWVLTVTNKLLDYEIKDEAIQIASVEALKGGYETKVYDVSDLLTPVEDSPSAYTVNLPVGQQTTTAAAQLTVGAEEEISLAQIIQRIAPNEWGPDRGSIRQIGQNILSIRQTVRMHQLISETLKQLRAAQAIQVSIVTRNIMVQDEFWEQIQSYFPSFANILHDEKYTKNAGDYAPWLTPGPYPNYPWGVGGKLGSVLSPPSIFNAGRAGWGADYNWVSGMTQNVIPTTPPDIAAAGLRFELWQAGFLGNIESQWVVRMLKESDKADQVSATNVMTYNNRRAVISKITSVPYIQDYEESQGWILPVIRYESEGIISEITPAVSADKQYITLNLAFGLKKIQSLYPFVALSTEVAEGQTASFSVGLPVTTTIHDEGTMMLPDGGSVLFSCVNLETDERGRGGVPVVSDIPVLGKLFSGRGITRLKWTNLILINGRMLLLDEEEEKLSR
ncbi:MAG: hypothetical protein V1918_10105 [Planctomycetota bacterium]